MLFRNVRVIHVLRLILRARDKSSVAVYWEWCVAPHIFSWESLAAFRNSRPFFWELIFRRCCAGGVGGSRRAVGFREKYFDFERTGG